jgi:hypothetical protein
LCVSLQCSLCRLFELEATLKNIGSFNVLTYGYMLFQGKFLRFTPEAFSPIPFASEVAESQIIACSDCCASVILLLTTKQVAT